jgi:hypothetical protein
MRKPALAQSGYQMTADETAGSAYRNPLRPIERVNNSRLLHIKASLTAI